MTVEPGEAVAGPWKELLLADLANLLSSDGSDKSVSRPQLVAIDGRGGAGKTFLADRLRAEIPSSAIVHTDDVAWHHSYFDWDEVLIKNVIQPLRANEAVDFRPEPWRVRGREGAIVVPAGMSVIWIEGTGSLRRSTLPLLDASVWVQVDRDIAERRLRVRDGADPEHLDFVERWQREERRFLLEQQPWTKATAIVAGSPVRDDPPPDKVAVAAPVSPRNGTLKDW